jgi:hypothetical protein
VAWDFLLLCGLLYSARDAHASHQRTHALPTELEPLGSQQVAQRARAGAGQFQVQFVDTTPSACDPRR